ncbi:hypothetical protein HGM15179_015119 [Zosterops borbonicus]|uniref:Uncharacterized protein n=1 Tax=Zosterops borbonicus TaxID=364589 RepID=A0A8K1G5G4_9PASS|nr:hypothetical protein HGM15179_015119 [Zosterops borbonicus]
MEGSPRSDSDRLCSAAARGDHEEVRRLLDAGVDPNGTNSLGRTPLQTKFSFSCQQLAKCLTLEYVDPPFPAGKD